MCAGKVRGGFTPRSRQDLFEILKPRSSKKCPFVNLPTGKTGHWGEGITVEDMAELQWLKPQYVAQIAFTEWTAAGLLRHASYLGLRDDKQPAEVLREAPEAS